MGGGGYQGEWAAGERSLRRRIAAGTPAQEANQRAGVCHQHRPHRCVAGDSEDGGRFSLIGTWPWKHIWKGRQFVAMAPAVRDCVR